MAELSGVLDELIDTDVIDAGDLAQIIGGTARRVGWWTAAKAMPAGRRRPASRAQGCGGRSSGRFFVTNRLDCG